MEGFLIGIGIMLGIGMLCAISAFYGALWAASLYERDRKHHEKLLRLSKLNPLKISKKTRKN